MASEVHRRPGEKESAGTSIDLRIVIKLIVPDQVMEGAVIDLFERGADRIASSIAGTAGALL
jgi:hypothetical protein